MKILLVITKAEIGGAQAVVLNLARELKLAGQEVNVAAGAGDYLPLELKKVGIPFFYLPHLKRNYNPLDIYLFIKSLRKLIKKENFSVIHFHSTNTLFGVFAISRLKKNIKTVFTVHGLSVLDRNYPATKFVKFIFRIYFKYFLHFIDYIIFVSKYNLEEAIKQKITKHGQVIYNGLDLSINYFLSHEDARQRLSSLVDKDLSEAYLLGSIGRLAKQKNYDFLIKNWSAIKKIRPNAKLLIIGDGPERIKYEKMTKDLRLQEDIFLLGKQLGASRFLRGFDFFVLPSIYEGLSISLIEAVFSGIPILASDVGGNREVIGVENCFKVNNQKDFINKFKQEKFIKIDKTQFSVEIMIRKYIEVYEEK